MGGMYSGFLKTCASLWKLLMTASNIEVALLDPKRLLKALNEDLKACQEAERFSSSDEDKERCELEFIA